MLGEDRAAAITHAEEHHGNGAARLEGTVRTITAAYYRLTPSKDRPTALEPVPGTTTLRPMTEANGYPPKIDGLSFRGYIVELA